MKISLLVVFFLVVGCANPGQNESDREAPVEVSGGTFLMGTDRADIAALRSTYGVDFPRVFENETPAHPVTVTSFRIDPHEVTYGQFAEFLDVAPEWRKERMNARDHDGRYLEDWTDGAFPEGKARHPVVFVTWAAARSSIFERAGATAMSSAMQSGSSDFVAPIRDAPIPSIRRR